MTITATPNDGHFVNRWQGDGTSAAETPNIRKVTMDGDKSVNAYFLRARHR